MLRISESQGADGVLEVRLEGSVVRSWVAELDRFCAERLAGGALRLEISGVSFLDRGAVALFRELERSGVELAGGSQFVREQLKAASTDWEEDLVARLRRGEDAAYETLVRTYGGRLLAVARRLLRSEDEARDALQEALVAAFRSIDRFHGEARLGSWLHRIVVNAALMRMRAAGHRREVALESAGEDGEPSGVLIWAEASQPATAEREVLAIEQRTWVRRAIGQLPERHRVVLMLRDIEELTTEETANLLGITPNAVKVRLHRARLALRDRLAPLPQALAGAA